MPAFHGGPALWSIHENLERRPLPLALPNPAQTGDRTEKTFVVFLLPLQGDTSSRLASDHQLMGNRISLRSGIVTLATVFERLSVLQSSPTRFRIATVRISHPLRKTLAPEPLTSERLSSLCKKGISTNAENRSARSAADTDAATVDVAKMPDTPSIPHPRRRVFRPPSRGQWFRQRMLPVSDHASR